MITLHEWKSNPFKVTYENMCDMLVKHGIINYSCSFSFCFAWPVGDWVVDLAPLGSGGLLWTGLLVLVWAAELHG